MLSPKAAFLLESLKNGRRMIAGSPNFQIAKELANLGLVTIQGKVQFGNQVTWFVKKI